MWRRRVVSFHLSRSLTLVLLVLRLRLLLFLFLLSNLNRYTISDNPAMPELGWLRCIRFQV